MTGKPLRFLLSGFEPFDNARVNPSELIVRRLALDGAGDARIELHTAVLPVEDARAEAALLAAFDRVRPHGVVCLGESSRVSAVTFERVFVNLKDYRIPDNAGRTVVDQPVAPDGPAAYFSTLPIRPLMAALEQAGVPTAASLSAGAFLCNQVAYRLMHRLARDRITLPAGFIHVPRLPDDPARHEARIGELSRAIASIIRALADEMTSESASRDSAEGAHGAG